MRAPEPGESTNLQLAHCVPIDVGDLKVTVALDLHFEQRWHFQTLEVGALAATIALAPSETLRITVRSSQRKVFNRTNLNEVEETESAEASIVDRDVLNVTRSSSRTRNWEVSGNGSVSIPIKAVEIGFGLSGSVSGSATQSATSTAEQVNEATRQSAHNLRSLHKVEVSETSETLEERDHSRRLVNPYRDRSLILKVYELAKQFCVDFSLEQTRPVVIFEITNMLFDRGFVLANGEFLEVHLVDNRLRQQLADALLAVIDPTPLKATQDIQKMATMALKYLFDEPNIFNVPNIQGQNANSPDSSFDAQLSRSGLRDATRNRQAIIFSTINFYFRLYRNEIGSDPQLAPDIALSLERALRPLWMSIEESSRVKNVLDTNDRTEAFRRLGGFLALVGGTIRPLLQPAGEERERIEAARRAEFVLQTVIDHLNCHKRYYIARYLEYLASATRGSSLQSFVEAALAMAAGPGQALADLGETLATEMAFVDRNTIVVPGRCIYSPAATSAFLKRLEGERAAPLPFGVLDVEHVFVPTEGIHLEPYTGVCRLEDVPEPSALPRVELAPADEPLAVDITDRGIDRSL